ncbi:MAG: nuclear transport factor 2 family protein [Bacteroidales bacterium]|jgi:hypothetical protein
MKAQHVSSKTFIPKLTYSGPILFLILLSSCQVSTKKKQTSYAEDRALIENLQARYMFALDNGDLDTYVSTFTEDGILDIGEGEWQGRDTIKHILASIPPQNDPPANSGLHRSTGRHNITNIVLKIEGDTARGRAYWFHMSNNNPQRRAQLNSYGHYEDVIVKVEGQWLFSRRKIYNEEVAKWASPEGNPCW